jgi:hypothetical protein
MQLYKQPTLPSPVLVAPVNLALKYHCLKSHSKGLFWTSIILSDKNELDKVRAKAGAINQSLQDSIPVLNNYQVLLQQYMIYDSSMVNPDERYVTLGTQYFIRNKCAGYLPNTNVKEITKKLFKPRFIQNLCK